MKGSLSRPADSRAQVPPRCPVRSTRKHADSGTDCNIAGITGTEQATDRDMDRDEEVNARRLMKAMVFVYLMPGGTDDADAEPDSIPLHDQHEVAHQVRAEDSVEPPEDSREADRGFTPAEIRAELERELDRLDIEHAFVLMGADESDDPAAKPVSMLSFSMRDVFRKLGRSPVECAEWWMGGDSHVRGA